ncbi:MAG TPA: peptidylprolyl isomerase [Gammaproteobacteria bacterium]|nr:peptidylprolyl isomerase [Gammaproteobacteria bacterium]
MLQAIRDRAMGWLGWIIMGLIIITFALFGLSSYLHDKGRAYAAKVNDVEITPRELQLAYQEQLAQLQQMLGDAYNPALIDEKLVKKRALDTLIERTLLRQAAQEAGMVISDQYLAAAIQSNPRFQEGGSFSKERYQRLLYQQGRRPAGYEEQMRRLLQAQQLVDGVTQTAFVTPRELEEAYRLQEQKRDFAYLLVPAKPLEKGIKVTDDEIKAYYDEHTDEFMVPEKVRLSYLRLTGDQLASGIEVDEEALRAYYEEKKESLARKEQRRARHILIQVPADADDATVGKARKEAEDLLQQIRKGADFAKLAKEHSDDPGSASRGGDLGFFARGAMVPEFDKAVFALEKGGIAGPVRTQFGFHIIQLTDIRAGGMPSLDEVRKELTAELQKREVDDLFYEQLEKLTDTSYENPGSLDAAADALGLKIQTSDWVSEKGGPGIGQYPALMAAVFSEDVLEGGNNSEPIEVGPNDVIVARVEEREPAHPAPLAEVKDRIAAMLKQQKARQQARATGESLLEKLRSGTPLKDLKAANDDYPLVEAANAARSASEYDREVLARVFKLPRPKDGAPVDAGFVLASGDYALVQLSGVHDGDPGKMSEEQRTGLRKGYESMRSQLMAAVLIEDLRRRAVIEIPEEQE